MQKYQSHKIVEAGKITVFHPAPDRYTVGIEGDTNIIGLTMEVGLRIVHMMAESTDGAGDDLGYLVKYDGGTEDEYISWSPSKQFEAGNSLVTGRPSFGEALGGLFRGERWTRTGWNGADQWIEMQVPAEDSKMQAPYIFISPVDGRLTPWLASQGDMLASDWQRV